MTGKPTPADIALHTRLFTGHKIHLNYRHRVITLAGIDLSCSCGHTASVEASTLRPAWEAIDAHLAEQVPGGVPVMACWCSRLAVRVEGNGAWYHLDQGFLGHRAFESRRSTTLGDEAYAAWLTARATRPAAEGAP